MTRSSRSEVGKYHFPARRKRNSHQAKYGFAFHRLIIPVEYLEPRLVLSVPTPPGTDQSNVADPIGSFRTVSASPPAPLNLDGPLVGQEFTPEFDSLNFVNLAVKNYGSTDEPIHINIRSTDGTNQILGTASATVRAGFDSIDENATTDRLRQLVPFTFSSPVTLTPHKSYLIEVVTDGPEPFKTLFYATSNLYAGGQLISPYTGASGMDLIFQEGDNSCQVQLGGSFKQYDPRWGSDLLGYSTRETISAYGCMLTALCIDLRIYTPQLVNQDYEIIDNNPGALNALLTSTPGVFGNGTLDHPDIEGDNIVPQRAIRAVADDVGMSGLTWTDFPAESLDALLCNDHIAPIVKLQGRDDAGNWHTHYVVADGESGSDFTVADPGSDAVTLSDAIGAFRNRHHLVGTISTTVRGYVSDPPTVDHSDLSLIVSAPNPGVNVVLSDTQGLQTGGDASGLQRTDIPKSTYNLDAIDDADGPGTFRPLADQSIYVSQPEDGIYRFIVSAPGDVPAPFGMFISTTSSNGALQEQLFVSGAAQPDMPSLYKVLVNPMFGQQAELVVPVLSPLPDISIQEGSALSLTASATDIDPNADLRFSLDPGAPIGSHIDPITGQLSWIANDGPSTAEFTVRATDGGAITLSTAETFTVTVVNVPPSVAAIVGLSVAVPWQPLSYTAAFTDPGVLDTHVAGLDWGDGSASVGTVAEWAGSGVATAGHAYASPGTYIVTATIIDKDGGSATTYMKVVVSQVAVEPDPVNPKRSCLYVGGAPSDDEIQIEHADNQGEDRAGSSDPVAHDSRNERAGIDVQIEGQKVHYQKLIADAIDRIVVYGGAGNDHIEVDRGIVLPAWLFGGNGNDILKAGGGPSLLLGGNGNDVLIGGSGRDVLIGGRGSDVLIGLGGDDLMIAGYTSFDDNDLALAAILAEWASDHNYATRIANLLGPGNDSRLNGSFFLAPGSTVFDDGSHDLLVGGSGDNWYLADLEGTPRDTIAGKCKGEIVTEVAP